MRRGGQTAGAAAMMSPEVGMYAALWRVLPGPVWLRVALLTVLALAVVAACFTWVFPAIAPFMPFTDVTVE